MPTPGCQATEQKVPLAPQLPLPIPHVPTPLAAGRHVSKVEKADPASRTPPTRRPPEKSSLQAHPAAKNIQPEGAERQGPFDFQLPEGVPDRLQDGA